MNFFKRFLGKSETPVKVNLSSEIEHINQEMYKKSAELSERNKTLSLLHKLDAIILGSIIHLNEIAQLVTTLLVKEADFENAFIYLYVKEGKILQRIAFSETEKPTMITYLATIPLSQINNLLAQSISEQTKKSSVNLQNIVLSEAEFEKIEVQQSLENIKSVQVFPLSVRNEWLGALVLSLGVDEQNLSEYKRDLLLRLADTIGIALDNALLYNEVQAANERLKQLDKLKDEFVSIASHELRTPMTAIKSYLWMALDGQGGPITDKQKYYLERAYTSVDRLMRLVSDMLNVSRIDSGRVTLELTSVALETLVEEVVEDVKHRAQELGITIQVTKGTTPLPPVLADSDKIKEVVFNLIGNSLKFTPKDGTISVSFKQNGDLIETTISDTGTGLAKEDIPKLFQKFGLIAESYASDRSIQGTGLGLYISKSIIDLHRGKIWVTSEGRGKGAQFIFALPIFHAENMPKVVDTSADKKTLGIIHTEI